MRQRTWQALAAAAWLAATPAVARADVTAFLGLSPTVAPRLVRGASAAISLVVVGFEIEAAQTLARESRNAPSLTTGMANVLVQTPFDVSRVQFYGTAGGGLYRETLGGRQETSVGVNLGAGIKYRLTGPLKLRIDYRVFRLQGSPLAPTVHRLYAGATLGF
jgi:opacity protein-like surface antigen